MLKIKFAAAAAIIALCSLFCACDVSADSSLKELTAPYITKYECTCAEWGGQNFLDGFDYVRITLLDKDTMEMSCKKKGEKEHTHKCTYEYNEETGELKAGAGALGIEFKEKIIIENGKFTLSFPLLGKELVMKFES